MKHFLQEIKPLSSGFPITEIIYLNFIHSEINVSGCWSLPVVAEPTKYLDVFLIIFRIIMKAKNYGVQSPLCSPLYSFLLGLELLNGVIVHWLQREVQICLSVHRSGAGFQGWTTGLRPGEGLL